MRPPTNGRKDLARSDPILLAALGLASGILLADRLADASAFCLLLCACLTACAVAGRWWWRSSPGPRRTRLTILLPCLAMLAPGLIRGRDLHSPTRHPLGGLETAASGARPKLLATVEGTLRTALMPAPRQPAEGGAEPRHRTTFRLGDLTLDAGLGPRAVGGGMLVLLPAGDRFLTRGTRIRVTGCVSPPEAPRNPGQADPRDRHRRDGIVLLLSVEDQRGIHELRSAGCWSPAAWMDRLRVGLLERLRDRLSPQASALSAALLLGFRNDLDPGLKDAIQKTGTLHLFAISGLHVALVIGVGRALIGLLLGPTLADLLAVVLALVYAALAGAGSPILRAATGCAVFFLGRCLQRRPRAFSSLSVAAMLLLLHDPGELFRPGFQLSFTAVAGLLISEPAGRRRGVTGLVRSALFVSVSASLATAPLLLHHFGRFALLGPLLTVLVTPLFLVSFAVILMHGWLCAACVPLARLAAPLVEVCCRALIRFFGVSADLSGGATAWQRPDWTITFGLLLVSGLILRRSTLPAVLVLGCVLLIGSPGRPSRGPLELWVFDVGHGQAVLLRSPDGQVLLFDCGSRGQPEIGRRTLLPALDHLGVRRIDTLVLSHSDADHLNGAVDLIEAGRVNRLVHGRIGPLGYWERAVLDAADRAGIDRRVAGRGTLLLDGPELRVEVLAPAPNRPPASDNDDSLVLLATFANRSILIPGDIESVGIGNLLELEPKLHCDVLVLPHHGNLQPLLSPLFHRLRPGWALASRPVPFPTPLVPRLAHRFGARLISTADSGAICVRIRTDGTIRADAFMETPTEQ